MNKTKTDGVFFFWSAAILLCMVIAIFALIFASCSGEKDKPAKHNDDDVTIESTETDTPPTDESPKDDANTGITDTTPEKPDENKDTSEPTEARLAETADAGQEYIDKFYFLGDSTTYGMTVYAKDHVDASQILTPASGTLTLNRWSIENLLNNSDGSEKSFADTFATIKPEYLMVTLGSNGVSFMGEDSFIPVYTEMVKTIQQASPDTKIILNTIYPTCSDYQYKDSISLEKITTANLWIEQIANDLGVRFLNTYEVLAGSDGYLPKELSNGDGIHLNEEGFSKIFTYIRTHAWN